MAVGAIGVGRFTHAGRRRENQDAVRVEAFGTDRFLAVVADGMGGHQGGGFASATAVEVVFDEIGRGRSIEAAVQAANFRLNEEAERPELRGMGTTVVGALVEGGNYHVFNVGDSRAYRVDASGVRQVTLDHSFVAETVRSGEMSEAEAEATQWRNALTRSLGGEPEVAIDVFGPFEVDTEHFLLLCSDGLYRCVPDHLMADVALGTPDAQTAANGLGSVAYRRGSDDNISAVLLEFGRMPRSAEAIPLPPTVDVQARLAPVAVRVGGPALTLPPVVHRGIRRGVRPIIASVFLLFAAVGWYMSPLSGRATPAVVTGSDSLLIAEADSGAAVASPELATDTSSGSPPGAADDSLQAVPDSMDSRGSPPDSGAVRE